MKPLSFDLKKLSLFKTLRIKYLGLLYHLSFPFLIQMSGCLKATTHLTNTPTSTEITLTTEYTRNNNTMVVKNEHSLIVPNDSDEEEVWDSSMLPFENDPQFQKLPPYYQDQILHQRRENTRKRLKAIKKKKQRAYNIDNIRDANRELLRLRKKKYDGEHLDAKELVKISSRSLSSQKKKQLEIFFEELKEKRENLDDVSFRGSYIKLPSEQIIRMRRNYLKSLPSPNSGDTYFTQMLIIFGLLSSNDNASSYTNEIYSNYKFNERFFFNSRVSRSLCFSISYATSLALIIVPYVVWVSGHNPCGYYKCVCESCVNSDMSSCSYYYYKSVDECQINELKEDSINVCKSTCRIDYLLWHIWFGEIISIFLFCYIGWKINEKYIESDRYFNKLKARLEKEEKLTIPEKLTILQKNTSEPSYNCCKRFVCNKTIVELSDGSKITQVCGFVDLPFWINFSKVCYKITGCFNWIFCAKQQSETSSQEVVDLLINSFE